MKIFTIAMLLLVTAARAEPLAPIVRQLDSKKITVIPIHHGMDTLLIFPKAVTLILGFGLTDGKADGAVQFQHEADAKLVVLRQLKEEAQPLMQIMLSGEDEAYVFRLKPSEEPASVIRFLDANKAVVASKSDDPAKLISKPSKARQAELMRLTAEAHVLREQIPEEYEGFEMKEVRFAHTKNGVTTMVTRVARFANEDALVFLGEMWNLNPRSFVPANHAPSIRVGSSKRYSPTQLLVSKQSIATKDEVEFRGIMLGDGADGSGHFSLENRITLELR